MPAASDRNLLFGILALQMDFVSRDQLIAAMNAWVLDKSNPLGAVLVEQKALDANRQVLLDALVQEHLKQHDNDPQKSLAALSPNPSVRQELEQVADADVHASLVHIPVAAADDPFATRSHSVGIPTSSGLRFRILRPHAKGGLGQVYVAHEEELHREVALKEIQERHADHPESRTRFLLEAEITGGLEHPGIVPVYGLGQYADGRPFYAMRFIKGDSLKDAIGRFHKKPSTDFTDDADKQESVKSAKSVDQFWGVAFRQLLGRFIDVCNAIAYAHSRGVLHRDLKPGNIMLGKYGETLVVDLGLAKPVDRPEAATDLDEHTLRPSAASGSAETQAGSAIGTPQFMSPEQAAGRLDLLGPASDVYSLGATLYCLLTGKPPFEGKDIGALLRQVQRGEFPRPRQQKPDVPAPLEAICLKAMALETKDRYGSPRALADDIEHWLADEPVSAAAEPATVRARRWMRKHPGAVSGIAAAVLVAVAGLSIGTILLGEKNRALSTVNQSLATANELVEGIFTDIDPRAGEKGGPLLIEQLTKRLLATADKLDEDAIGDPLTVARLRNFLGKTLAELGESKKAIELFGKARATRDKLLGPDHPETLMSMNNLAAAYLDAGKLDLSLPLHKETLKLRKAKLGPDHRDTLDSMNNLAEGY